LQEAKADNPKLPMHEPIMAKESFWSTLRLCLLDKFGQNVHCILIAHTLFVIGGASLLVHHLYADVANLSTLTSAQSLAHMIQRPPLNAAGAYQKPPALDAAFQSTSIGVVWQLPKQHPPRVQHPV